MRDCVPWKALPVVMGRRPFALTAERLIPFEALRNIGDGNKRPHSLHALLLRSDGDAAMRLVRVGVRGNIPAFQPIKRSDSIESTSARRANLRFLGNHQAREAGKS
jgi:hypothetical protein